VDELGEGLGDGLGEGLEEGLGDGLAGVGVAQAWGLAVVVVGATAIAAGPWLAKYSATGTMIMPTITVSTKVTAPHSRRTKAQFTSREL
jgi:hypothetical protein